MMVGFQLMFASVFQGEDSKYELIRVYRFVGDVVLLAFALNALGYFNRLRAMQSDQKALSSICNLPGIFVYRKAETSFILFFLHTFLHVEISGIVIFPCNCSLLTWVCELTTWSGLLPLFRDRALVW
jgi:hypothetical protein